MTTDALVLVVDDDRSVRTGLGSDPSRNVPEPANT